MSTGMVEQRQARRVAFESQAVIRYERDQVVEARVDTRNISLSGLYLETEAHIPVDTPCDVTIQLAGATSKMQFEVQGLVRRHDQTGMGIVFTHLGPDSYLHITNLVKLHDAEGR